LRFGSLTVRGFLRCSGSLFHHGFLSRNGSLAPLGFLDSYGSLAHDWLITGTYPQLPQ
jgi:hypothetical protein